MIFSVLLFIFIAITTISGLVSPVVRGFRYSNVSTLSRQSIYLAESGAEDIYYRAANLMSYGGTEVITLDGNTVTTTTTNPTPTEVQIISEADAQSVDRKVQVVISANNTITFQEGMQFGDGGIQFDDIFSQTIGNVLSSGPIIGQGANTMSTGDVISGGSSGYIGFLRVIDDAYANFIENVIVGQDAYYQTILNSTVAGNSYPGSADQPVHPLPISDAMITNMEALAEAGGEYKGPCPYSLTANASIGPLKIPCDMQLGGPATYTIDGPVWVEGNITADPTVEFAVGAGLGSNSVAMIADNPADRLTSSQIVTPSTGAFVTGPPYVVLISQNNSSELGGLQDAISIQYTLPSNVIPYASHGNVAVTNTVNATGVYGYSVNLDNSSVLTTRDGPLNVDFPAGVVSNYSVLIWRETL